MNAEEQALENRIQELGLNAPRLTPKMIDDLIVGETYVVLQSGRTMVCELTLKNGYTVTGTSSVMSAANFNKEIGMRISRANAREKIWELEAYRLFDQYGSSKTAQHNQLG